MLFLNSHTICLFLFLFYVTDGFRYISNNIGIMINYYYTINTTITRILNSGKKEKSWNNKSLMF